jgi:hypothetical protein
MPSQLKIWQHLFASNGDKLIIFYFDQKNFFFEVGFRLIFIFKFFHRS